MYGPSQLGWNFLFAALAVFSKILVKTNSPGRNVRDFTRWLWKFASLCWYDAMRTTAASRSSSVVSKSLVMALAFDFSGISARTVGIPISMGMMASILYVRVSGDTLVGWLVVLYAHKTVGSSFTHFPLVECRRFFRADRRVLLDVSAWPLLCGYRGVEFRFLIFNLLQKFLYS